MWIYLLEGLLLCEWGFCSTNITNLIIRPGTKGIFGEVTANYRNYIFLKKNPSMFKNKTTKSTAAVTLTLGQPALRFLSERHDALIETVDELLFCAFFSLCCLISSGTNQDLEMTSWRPVTWSQGVSCVSLDQIQWWKDGTSAGTAALSHQSASSEGNGQNVQHLNQWVSEEKIEPLKN